MRIIAHRGASGTRPENTMAAFSHAAAAGAGWIETDIVLMGDGSLLVFHDSHLGRVVPGKSGKATGGTSAVEQAMVDGKIDWDVFGKIVAGEKAIADLAYADVAGLDAGSWFDGKYADERLLSLPQLLDWRGQNGVGLILDVKTYEGKGDAYHAICAGLKSALGEAGLMDEAGKMVGKAADGEASGRLAKLAGPIILSSFDSEFLAVAAEQLPHLPRGLIVWKLTDGWQARAEATQAAAIHLSHRFLTEDQVQAMHAAGLAVAVFTINEAAAMQPMRHWGVESVFSDYPEKFV